MPHQNEIEIQLTPAHLTAIDAALTSLETVAGLFVVLSADDKASFVKAPDDAGDWMNGMLTRAEQNIDHLPREFDPAGVKLDLDLDAALGPRELRLHRVLDRIGSARFMARSDAFAELLSVRRALKDVGVAGVDDNLSDGLKRFFSRSAKAIPAVPAPAAK